MARTKKTGIAARPIRARVLVLVVFLLLLYVVVPQVDAFSQSFAVLRTAHIGLAIAGAFLVMATYVLAAAIYQLLALRPLRYASTLHVQGASAFANRILPVGLGGLTLNVQYLRHQRYSLAQALAVAGTNNTLGLVGHLLLLGVALLVGGGGLREQLDIGGAMAYWYVLVIGLGLIGLVLYIATGLRKQLMHLITMVARQFGSYRKRPGRLVAALGCSVCLTLLYVAIFYVSSVSVGSDIGYAEALIIFSAGIIVGTVTPTPGGLGGVEAGLVAGAVAYGIDASVALAGALLYRLLTYWLPLVPGFILFMAGRKLYS
jgi:uncharacterized membrane protein YbhN (UPF0104 family)